jgi:hypothetical protein
MTTCDIAYANCPIPVVPMRFPLGITLSIGDLHMWALWIAVIASALLVIMMLAGMRRYGAHPVPMLAVGARHRARVMRRVMLGNPFPRKRHADTPRV